MKRFEARQRQVDRWLPRPKVAPPSPDPVEVKYGPAFADSAKDESRYHIEWGGAGSGKSVFCADKLIDRCQTEARHKFLAVRKVKNTIRHSVFAELVGELDRHGLKSECRINKSTHDITFPNGAEIITAGLDDTDKLKSISGITGIWIEEATDLLESDFNELDRRLRGETPGYKQILISFNPIDDRHWLKKRFIDAKPPNTYVQHTTLFDNPFIDQDEYAQILGLQSEVEIDVYLHGKWGHLIGGLIYPDWDTFEDIIWEPDFYGLDFGFVAPSALIACKIVDESHLYVWEEIYQRRIQNVELIRMMEEYEIDNRIPIYADNAEQDRIEQIHAAGFNVHEAKKDVEAGIDAVLAFQPTPADKRIRLHIHQDSHNILDEARSYVWMEDRNGQRIDKPVKANDHAWDAIRYGVFTHGSVTETLTGVRTIPGL